MQCVSHTLGFCVQVARIEVVGFYLYAHIFHNLKSITFEPYAFYRIVCYEAHFVNTYLAQNLGTNAIIPLIGFETEA